MPTTNNTASMRAWLRMCPSVARKRLFGADYLADVESYSLDVTPTALRYLKNILGEMVLRETQEQNFVFASRDPYGAEFQQNLDNLGNHILHNLHLATRPLFHLCEGLLLL